MTAAYALFEERRSPVRWLVEFALIEQQRYQNATCDALIYELHNVLHRDERVTVSFADDFVDGVASKSIFTKIRGVGMGVRDWRDDKVVEPAMNAGVDAIVSQDRDLHDARARYSIGKTGIGICDRPIAVWDVGTFLGVLNGSPRFSPLVVATLAA